MLVLTGADSVPRSQGPTPRNDFCRILTQEGLLDPISNALLAVCGDPDDLAESAKAKIVHVLLLFAQSDHKVKEAMARRSILLRACSPSSPSSSSNLLFVELTLVTPPCRSRQGRQRPRARAPRHPAQDDQELVDAARRARAASAGRRDRLARLAPRPDVSRSSRRSASSFLCRHRRTRAVSLTRRRRPQEIQNHAVNALFNLCRLSKARQAEAAAAGAIPLLQQIVNDNSPLKQFALPVLCDCAHAGKATRRLCVALSLLHSARARRATLT